MLDVPLEIPLVAPTGARIYKDDCMFNFDTPINNELGLDVDLISYQGFSRGKTYNYTVENYKRTGNSLYLNIKKELKPEPERKYDEHGETSPKLQKLAVKDITDEDIYNKITSIYDAKNDKSYSIEEITPRFQALVDSVLNANSSGRADEIKQWQQEILPCQHSLALDLTPASRENLTQCELCDLQENLWICLGCGQIGCGRQQYGLELKGNSHALKHYEDCQHPVAIKLGSLTADEADCDAYCYACGDEVKVPNLAQKLNLYGIDLSKTVKTEKNLTELNIDRNMNWEFKLDGANGEKLEPVFGAGLTGFKNLGNTCYINSVLQSLFNFKEYQEGLSKLKLSADDPSDDLETQLVKLYDGLFSGRYSKPTLLNEQYQLGIKPTSFKNLIGHGHDEFSTQRQQDAHEFLTHFLNKVDETLGLTLNKQLNFLMENKIVCSNCHRGKVNTDLLDNLVVKIKEEIIEEVDGKKVYEEAKIADSLSEFCSDEAIDGYSCDCCGKSTVAIKSTGFSSFPENLIITALRIKLENWVPVKIDVPVEVPHFLDLSEFVAKGFVKGEVEAKQEEPEQDSFVPNASALETLGNMGFPETRSTRALYHTGNNNAEDAMNWLFGHMEDIDIDEPFVAPKVNKSVDVSVPAELVANLQAMGFGEKLCKKALILNKNDPNEAVEWLFSNPDDDGEIATSSKVNISSERDQLKKDLAGSRGGSKYELQAVVCHKGTSPHTGHYVSFVKKQLDGVDKWVLFNDEKVVQCDNLDELKNNGYIYFYKRVA